MLAAKAILLDKQQYVKKTWHTLLYTGYAFQCMCMWIYDQKYKFPSNKEWVRGPFFIL